MPASYRRSRRAFDMPAWLYYVVAAFLVLLTVPMYRVLLSVHTAPVAPLPNVQPSSSTPVSVVSSSAISPVYECMSGRLFEHRSTGGFAVLQDGHFVSCGDAARVSMSSLPRHLAPDEHCVGGVVVRVDQVRGVTTYTQEMDGSRSVTCQVGVY